MVDTVITLGSFTFQDLEVPQSINFGGDQRLVVHEMVGGARDVQTLGAQPADISWSGLMTGPDALTRAQQLNQMRIAGNTLSFSVFSESYSVIIASFSYYTERYYQVEYSITLKVVVDYNSINSNATVVGFDDQIMTDFTNASSLATIINDPVLNNIILGASGNINNTDFPSATPSTITTTTDQLNGIQTQTQVDQLIAQAKATGGV